MATKNKRERRLEILNEQLEEERLRKELAQLEAEEHKDIDCYNPKKRMIIYWKSRVNRM